MGWFNRSLKGNSSVGTDDAGPPRYEKGTEYAPPPGPPPSQQNYAPPPGPPPSHIGAASSHYDYAPPSGPPPSHETYAPPPGPPPSHSQQQPYVEEPDGSSHNWQSVPDTALYPPPPTMSHMASEAGNASEDEAVRAKEWCKQYPLAPPRSFAPETLNSRSTGMSLDEPREFKGRMAYSQKQMGRVTIKSEATCPDTSLIGVLPLYAQNHEFPLYTEQRKTIYFEVQITSMGKAGRRGEDPASLSVGFVGRPYPTWRQPGWDRGSLGVHGDDGRRYINDSYGGKEFTDPFKRGERIGVGMIFSLPQDPSAYDASNTRPQLAVKAFLTRNGSPCGNWDIHEERDADEDPSVEGLEGLYDLYPAVGLFGAVEFDVVFDSNQWMHRPQ